MTLGLLGEDAMVERVIRVLVLCSVAHLSACGGANDAPLTTTPTPSATPTSGPPTTTSGTSTPSSSPSATPTTQVPAGYVLVWADEFESNGEQLPDPAKWSYDVGRNKLGWYNNEKQYYANARLQNSKVSGGQLVITARKETLNNQSDWGGQSYTSARLITKGKASWTYGFFDVRAKLPCATGTWPAIWTLGAGTDPWPLQGEIDIMEQTGWDKTEVSGTIHTQSGSAGNGSTGSTTVPDACRAFHNYQVTWTPQMIRFSVDGVTYRSDYTNTGTGINSWPFDKPQFMILNLAMGGTLGGTIVDSMLPATFEIDYVRVYQKPLG